VSCRFLPTGNEVMLSWAFDIAAKTAVTNGETIVTLPSGYHYTDNKILPGNLSGAVSGNQYAPGYVTAAGAFQYNGAAFNSASTGWWYGQGIYTLSLG